MKEFNSDWLNEQIANSSDKEENIGLYDEAYQERLAICLAENVPQELAEKIAHQCAMKLIKGEE